MTLTKTQLIRMSDEDHREVVATAKKLGLPTSEITRRSLRIALPILRGVNLPGGARSGDDDGPEAA